jgi:hypothetical protein
MHSGFARMFFEVILRPMRLNALSIGLAVPHADFEATVHSIFHSAINLALGDGTLIALLTLDRGETPHGIRLNTPDGFTFEQQGVTARAEAARRGGNLRIAGAGFSVDLRAARRWQARLDEVNIDLSKPNRSSAWRVAFDALAAHPETSQAIAGVALLVTQHGVSGDIAPLAVSASGAVRALVQATSAFRLDEARKAAGDLVGLGPGLTPSGDDFLTGYLAGLWVTAGVSSKRRGFAEAFAAEVEKLAARTNDISRTFLVDAAQRQVSGVIADLIRAIAYHDDPETIRQAAQAAMAVGKTSGTDSVAGLLLGLMAWQKQVDS